MKIQFSSKYYKLNIFKDKLNINLLNNLKKKLIKNDKYFFIQLKCVSLLALITLSINKTKRIVKCIISLSSV